MSSKASVEYLSAKYDADTLTVDYAAGDGSHLLRTGGTAAWRFNNPGNLRPNKKGAAIYGAIGIAKTKTNNSFLIFSSYEEGRKQKKLLLRRKYNDRTIYTMLAGVDDGKGNMVEGYAPASDNNDPAAYADAISSKTGISIDTKIFSLSDAQLDSVMNAMQEREGYDGRKDTRQEQIVHTTSLTVSDGAKPKSGVAAKVQIGEQEHHTQTDRHGRLPLIVHTDAGKQINVFMISMQGEWEKVYTGIMEAQSHTVALFNPLGIFSGPMEKKNPPASTMKTSRTPIRYVVQSGDTLGKIASRFKTSTAAIERDNPQIRNVARIYPAQVLSIYGSASKAPLKSPASPKTLRHSSETTIAVIAPPAEIPASTIATRSKDGQGSPLALLMPDQKQAPWMQIAVEEAKKWAGKAEDVITKTSNFHALTGSGFLTTMVGTANAWCGSFVNYCLSRSSPPYVTWKNSFRARAVALDANFIEIDTPIFGAILLVGTHHVSLVYAKDGENYVCLGGNQSDQINFSSFKKDVRFFIPLVYQAFAKQEIAKGDSLSQHTATELNSAFGIPLKKKKGDATR